VTLDGRLVPVVLYPRFTTFVGEGVQFRTFAVDVAPYEGARLAFWRGPIVGDPSAVLKFFLEESQTRDDWAQLGSTIEPSEASETGVEVTFTRKWFRVTAEIALGSGSVTCWGQGVLVKRET